MPKKSTEPASPAAPQAPAPPLLNAQARYAEKLLEKATSDLGEYIDHDGDAVFVPVDVLARAYSWLKSMAVVYHADQLRRQGLVDEFLADKNKLADKLTDTPPERGSCHFCAKEVGKEAFCSGCKKFICESCDTNPDMPFGRHDPQTHRADPDDDGDEA